LFFKANKTQFVYISQIPSIDILNITEGIGMAIIDPKVKAEEMYIGKGTTMAWKLMQGVITKRFYK
jgi:hypothetical protein